MYTLEHIVPVSVATIAGMGIGALWYSPLMFDKAWKALAFPGRVLDEAQMKKDAPKAMLGMLVVLFFKVCILRYLLQLLGVSDALSGAQYGFWIGIGLIATTLLDGVLFERKPLKLYYINVGYHMVSMVVIGSILGAW